MLCKPSCLRIAASPARWESSSGHTHRPAHRASRPWLRSIVAKRQRGDDTAAGLVTRAALVRPPATGMKRSLATAVSPQVARGQSTCPPHPESDSASQSSHTPRPHTGGRRTCYACLADLDSPSTSSSHMISVTGRASATRPDTTYNSSRLRWPGRAGRARLGLVGCCWWCWRGCG